MQLLFLLFQLFIFTWAIPTWIKINETISSQQALFRSKHFQKAIGDMVLERACMCACMDLLGVCVCVCACGGEHVPIAQSPACWCRQAVLAPPRSQPTFLGRYLGLTKFPGHARAHAHALSAENQIPNTFFCARKVYILEGFSLLGVKDHSMSCSL